MINDTQLIQLRLEAISLAQGDIDRANVIMNYLTSDLISDQLAKTKTDAIEQTTLDVTAKFTREINTMKDSQPTSTPMVIVSE
jgi:hypothetical protein